MDMMFAGINGFEAVSSYLNKTPSFRDNWHFLVATFLVALLWYLLYFFDKRHSTPKNHTPETPLGLIEGLSLAHHLSRNEQKLLLRVASVSQTTHPAVVCVDPRFLLAYAEQDDSLADAARELARKLFGDLAKPG